MQLSFSNTQDNDKVNLKASNQAGRAYYPED